MGTLGGGAGAWQSRGKADQDRDVDWRADRRRAWRAPGAGHGGDRAAGRRGDRAVHRALPQGDDRRAAVIDSIRAQGKLDTELEARILAADSKARLEDLYLPFRPKRRTRAQIAREAGLEPLAERLLADPARDPREVAAAFVDDGKGVADVPAALEGARAILVERFAEDADLIGSLRERMWSRGRLVSRVRDGKQEAGAKFADYFDFAEPFSKLPSHRILAMFRGESEEVLDLTF